MAQLTDYWHGAKEGGIMPASDFLGLDASKGQCYTLYVKVQTDPSGYVDAGAGRIKGIMLTLVVSPENSTEYAFSGPPTGLQDEAPGVQILKLELTTLLTTPVVLTGVMRFKVPVSGSVDGVTVAWITDAGIKVGGSFPTYPDADVPHAWYFLMPDGAGSI